MSSSQYPAVSISKRGNQIASVVIGIAFCGAIGSAWMEKRVDNVKEAKRYQAVDGQSQDLPPPRPASGDGRRIEAISFGDFLAMSRSDRLRTCEAIAARNNPRATAADRREYTSLVLATLLLSKGKVEDGESIYSYVTDLIRKSAEKEIRSRKTNADRSL